LFAKRRFYEARLMIRTLTILFLLLAGLSSGQTSSSARYAEAESLIANRKLERAEKMVVGWLTNEPHNPVVITLLAEIRLDQGRPSEAIQLVNDAERLSGVTSLRAQIVGLAESAMGRLTPAEAKFRQAIQLDPNFVAAHYYLSRLLYTRNRFDEAIQESKTTIALSPDFVRAYENLGLCFEGKGQPKEAEEWYREAIRRNETSSEKTEWPLLDLATMLLQYERVDEARPLLNEALTINPQNAHSHFEMGILLEHVGDNEAALHQYRDAINYDAGLAGAYYRAARLCQKLGRKDESNQLFEQFKRVAHEK
jgi:tetratricopeptide (TPR) repeat protein